MVSNQEKAWNSHDKRLQLRTECSLRLLGRYTGLDEKTALAVSGGFGGGVRCGEICGAVSGAVMAMGLAFPFNDGDDAQAKAKIAKLTECRDQRTFGKNLAASAAWI